jgi:hypothetical protein
METNFLFNPTRRKINMGSISAKFRMRIKQYAKTIYRNERGIDGPREK